MQYLTRARPRRVVAKYWSTLEQTMLADVSSTPVASLMSSWHGERLASTTVMHLKQQYAAVRMRTKTVCAAVKSLRTWPDRLCGCCSRFLWISSQSGAGPAKWSLPRSKSCQTQTQVSYLSRLTSMKRRCVLHGLVWRQHLSQTSSALKCSTFCGISYIRPHT